MDEMTFIPNRMYEHLHSCYVGSDQERPRGNNLMARMHVLIQCTTGKAALIAPELVLDVINRQPHCNACSGVMHTEDIATVKTWNTLLFKVQLIPLAGGFLCDQSYHRLTV